MKIAIWRVRSIAWRSRFVSGSLEIALADHADASGIEVLHIFERFSVKTVTSVIDAD